MRVFWALFVLAMPSAAIAQSSACAFYEGAVVVAEDGEYLGRVTSPYASDSIFNKFGHGSKVRAESIWNQFGTYGNPYSAKSIANRFTSTPPMLVKDRQIIGYLTKNKNLNGAVDPLILGIVCYEFEPD